MKVLIIEDEKLATDRLEKLLHQYDDGIEVLSKIDSVKKSLQWLKSNASPDLVLMDIELADGLSFEIFEKTELTIPVIFTTAYNEYAIKAFKVNSIDYLLKPIDFKDLKTSIDKLKFLQNNALYKSINQEQLKATREGMKEYKSRFIVKIRDSLHSIPIEQISCFFTLEKITYLKTITGNRYIVDYTLEEIENLVSPKNFFRINRKYIVTISSIENIVSYSNSRLKIKIKNLEDTDAIVSREKVNAFKLWLDL